MVGCACERQGVGDGCCGLDVTCFHLRFVESLHIGTRGEEQPQLLIASMAFVCRIWLGCTLEWSSVASKRSMFERMFLQSPCPDEQLKAWGFGRGASLDGRCARAPLWSDAQAQLHLSLFVFAAQLTSADPESRAQLPRYHYFIYMLK